MALVATSTGIKAGRLPESALPFIGATRLCQDHIDGFCRKGDLCAQSHKICRIEEANATQSRTIGRTNPLSLEPRLPCQLFEDDGPGELAVLGPRHDNDHIDIEHIQILPTTDEILSLRPPYMPSRILHAQHRLPLGPSRLLDINFRQLRYENVEIIIDCTYHASQQLESIVRESSSLTDYDDRIATPKGSWYSLFRDVAFEDIIFHDTKGIMFRISFACPSSLRGTQMGTSSHFENGMLVALIGLASDDLSVTFMEVHQRQTTGAMRPRTRNDLRASIILSLANPKDISAVRRLLYNMHGPLKETFVLVEIPCLLYASFYWTLKHLQYQSTSHQPLAFTSTIAPASANAIPITSLPKYAMDSNFSFHLDILSKSGAGNEINHLTLKPAEFVSDPIAASQMIKTICRETTFDEGQAGALCESLCRDLAFTQGPPGTGKTFLGIGLARVLLASRHARSRKPVLIVCMTNHALDSFLGGLREAGILGLARFGNQSKEDWTNPYRIRSLARRVKKTTFEITSLQQVRYQVEALTIEGRSWCEALNGELISWPAVREYLSVHHSHILPRFTEVEKSDQSAISDIRLARKAGGFAFKYWCEGGDINDINLLIERFDSLLGNSGHFNDFDPRHSKVQERVHRNIEWNARDVQAASCDDDIWKLTLPKRELLLEEWNRQIEAQSTLDHTAEMHRRHQDAISRRHKIRSDFEARVLEDVDIIATTTTSCAMNWQQLEGLCLEVVICEEAGEVMEAQSLCTFFPTIEHAISIGDPLQLRPQISEQSLSLEIATGSKYRLDESLMERLVLPTASGNLPIPYSRLNIQRRMHPEIADLLRATLYPYLQDHESTAGLEKVAGLVDRVFWLDHKAPQDLQNSLLPNATSFSNAYEVEMVAGMVQYLVSSNEYDYKDITILTPYNGQLAAFMAKLNGSCSLWLSEKDREALTSDGLLSPEDSQDGIPMNINISDMLRLATIDNFQGEESKIVILSLVRSNNAGHVGFMKTSNRINVACSRAQNGFYIVGNANLMGSVPMWRQITSLLALNGKIGPSLRVCCPRHPETVYQLQEPHQWHMLPPCQAPCDFHFACGHRCSALCHAPSLHERAGCREPCVRVHEMCGHVCSGYCGQPCGDCSLEQVVVVPACGHEANVACAEIRDGKKDILCKRQIGTRLMECGHEQDTICSMRDTNEGCTEKCGVLLLCGHRCQASCVNCTHTEAHPVCQAACQKAQPHCRHLCDSTCHFGSDCPPCQQPCETFCIHGGCERGCSNACDPCTKICDWECKHEGSCASLCSLPCCRLPCSERCDKILSCGHPCSSLCGERCATVCFQCINGAVVEEKKMFLVCGHHFDVTFLDNFVGIDKLYQINDCGRIQAVVLGSLSQTGSVNLQCPTCSESCSQLRRYLLHKQLCDFDSILDRSCALFARMINHFLKRTYAIKMILDTTFQSFQQTIRPGPLTGKANEQSIRERVSALNDLQQNLVVFRDQMVTPFEAAMASLTAFFGCSDKLWDSKWSFRTRVDMIYQQCRLITLSESVRMIKTLEVLSQQSRHTAVMIEGLRALTISQAKNQISEVSSLITDCQDRHLKRLECEARLLRACFHRTLQELGDKRSIHSDMENLKEAQLLCVRYPDTAGLLLPAYNNIRLSICRTWNTNRSFYDTEYKMVWWRWPKHHVGALEQCPSGHLYSSLTWLGCPECGREVSKPEKFVPTPLQDQEFMLAMKKTPANFDGAAYRR